MSNIRELRGRIASVTTSGKITGAMKMIASAKLKRAQLVLQQSEPYLNELTGAVQRVLSVQDPTESLPCTLKRTVRKRVIVVFASDEGLCGMFNRQLAALLLEQLRAAHAEGEEVKVLLHGGRVRSFLGSEQPLYWQPVRDEKMTTQLLFEEASSLINRFQKGEIDKIDLIYSYYKSVGRQIPTLKSWLPFVPADFLLAHAEDVAQKTTNNFYLYEPDRQELEESLIPAYLQALYLDAWMHSAASEQAARVLSMQLANDNASKLLDSLGLEYNKLRQQGITAELLDIMGGTER